MIRIIKSSKKRLFLFFVNVVLRGPHFFRLKRLLLCKIGYKIGVGTKIVGPFYCSARIEIGMDCWIGKDFVADGNGWVFIGNRCDLGPNVSFQTGGHEISAVNRRAGKGCNYTQKIGDGCWIGSGAMFIKNICVGDMSVIAARALVNHDFDSNKLIVGMPARIVKSL